MAGNKKRRIKPGPQPKPIEKTRRNRLMLNLTDSEYEELVDASAGNRPSDFARSMILRFLARRRRRK